MKGMVFSASLFCVTSAFAADGVMDVYKLATENDTQITAANYNKKAAEQRVPLAEAALMPKVGLTATHKISRYDDSVSGFENDYAANQIALQVTQPIYHHADWVSLDQAERVVSSAEMGYTQAEHGLIIRTAQAYFNVLRAQDALAAANANKRAASKQYNQAKQQYDVGAIAITDVHEAAAAVDGATTQVIAAKSDIDNAKEALSLMTGQPANTLRKLKSRISLNMPSPNNVDAWVDTGLENSLTLKTAKLDTEIAQMDIERIGAGNYPTLDLQAQYAYNEGENVQDIDVDESAGSVSLNLNWNIYSGGAISAQKRQAAYYAMAAKTQLDESDRNLKTNVRTAFRNVKTAISQVRAQTQALSSAHTALNATRSGYEVGSRTIVEVLNAQQRVTSANQNLKSARYDYLLAHLALKQAAGIITADDLRLIENNLK